MNFNQFLHQNNMSFTNNFLNKRQILNEAMDAEKTKTYLANHSKKPNSIHNPNSKKYNAQKTAYMKGRAGMKMNQDDSEELNDLFKQQFTADELFQAKKKKLTVKGSSGNWSYGQSNQSQLFESKADDLKKVVERLLKNNGIKYTDIIDKPDQIIVETKETELSCNTVYSMYVSNKNMFSDIEIYTLETDNLWLSFMKGNLYL